MHRSAVKLGTGRPFVSAPTDMFWGGCKSSATAHRLPGTLKWGKPPSHLVCPPLTPPRPSLCQFVCNLTSVPSCFCSFAPSSLSNVSFLTGQSQEDTRPRSFGKLLPQRAAFTLDCLPSRSSAIIMTPFAGSFADTVKFEFI